MRYARTSRLHRWPFARSTAYQSVSEPMMCPHTVLSMGTRWAVVRWDASAVSAPTGKRLTCNVRGFDTPVRVRTCNATFPAGKSAANSSSTRTSFLSGLFQEPGRIIFSPIRRTCTPAPRHITSSISLIRNPRRTTIWRVPACAQGGSIPSKMGEPVSAAEAESVSLSVTRPSNRKKPSFTLTEWV